MRVLGIETSCDETSVALLENDKVLVNLVSSQHFHSLFGGVVPELSSRAHLQMIMPLVNRALSVTETKIQDIDAVAATSGPGLIGALLVGLSFAKGLSYSTGMRFVPVNHIEGHIYSGFLMEDKPEYPYLCLVASGGHTLLLIVESNTKIIKLGSTIDDAVGEAFDKTAKLLNLGYPGGPAIQHYASKGNPDFIDFPVANLKTEYDFSFSGVKTSVLRFIQKNFSDLNKLDELSIRDIAASFQKSIVKALSEKTEKALRNFNIKSISLVGGVAANFAIRERLKEIAKLYNKKISIPKLEYCGDNGAMIAVRGKMLIENGFEYNYNVNAFASLQQLDLMNFS